MKTPLLSLSLIPLLILASSCGGAKGTKSVNSKGNCTRPFRTSYQAIADQQLDVNAEVQAYQKAQSALSEEERKKADALIEPKQVLINAMMKQKELCAKFYAEHSAVTCKAKTEEGEIQVLASEGQRKNCAANDARLQAFQTDGKLPDEKPKGPVAPTPRPGEGGTDDYDYT